MTVGKGVTDVVIVPGPQARHPKWRIDPLILSATVDLSRASKPRGFSP